MKKLIVVSSFLVGLLTSLAAQNAPWTLEVSSGYDVGFGQAISWTTLGNADPSHQYVSKSRDSVGNSGFHGELRAGYDFLPNVGLTVASSLLVGTPVLKSGYTYDSAGKVVDNWSDSFNFATIRLTPAVRFWILSNDQFRLYSSLGPMLIIASPINEYSSNSWDSMETSTRYFYGLGLGVQGEFGAEVSLGKNWGVLLACSVEKISLPRASIEDQDASGNETTTTYSDHPSTNSDAQTASDVAKSDSSHAYYTYPTVWDDFSDLSLKVGLIWHF